MRITMQALHRNMIGTLNNRYGDLSHLQEQLSTGKRLLRPSDDPVDVSNDLELMTRQKELLQHKANIEDSISYMSITETAMDSTNYLMQRMRELAVEGSTDTLGADERAYLNKEVEQLTRQMVALVNTKFKGDYIFSGQQTKLPPLTIESSASETIDDYTSFRMAYFNAGTAVLGDTVQIFNGLTGDPVSSLIPGSFELSDASGTYRENTDYTVDYENGTITILNSDLLVDASPGQPDYAITGIQLKFDYLARSKDVFGQTVSNRGAIEREIESGITMQINIGMDEMTTDVTSGISLFDALIRFGQGLVQNDRPSISHAIDELDVAFNTALSAQSKNGARMNRLLTTLERNEEQYTQVTSLQSELEDAEMAETASQFALTQNVYNAALQSTAKIIQQSLVNFL